MLHLYSLIFTYIKTLMENQMKNLFCHIHQMTVLPINHQLLQSEAENV